MKKLVFVLMLIGMSVMSLSAQAADAYLRFVHVIPGVSAIDIYTNGELTVRGLAYGEASNYVMLEDGLYQITVTPSGITTELWRQQISALADTPQTLIASSIDPLQFQTFEDDFSPLAAGTSRLRLIHAIDGAAAVDVSSADQTVVGGLAYGATSGGFDLPASSYPFTITAAGAELLPETLFNLVSNTTQMAIVYGTPNAPEVLVASAPVGAESGAGFVRIAHTVIDAPAVDVYANDILLVPGLEFGAVTEHLPLPAGDYAIQLRAAGTSNVVLDATLAIAADEALTIAAVGTPDEITVNVFTDDFSGVTADTAVVSVLNTAADSTASVTLSDGTALATDLAYNTAGSTVSLSPVVSAGTLSVTIGDQTASIDLDAYEFYGGVYYNAIVLGGNMFQPTTVIFAETSIAQSVASAPGADTMSIAVAVESTSVPAATEVAVQPTEVVVVQPTEVVVVQPTEVVVAPTPEPVAPVVSTPAPEGPTARVNLDPNANLQLRQYPRASALSLGLAPSGTNLLVNGREGAPIDFDGNVIQAEDEEGNFFDWVDPVTLLEDEDADLAPEETWLNVTFLTPDGGEIVAWINALYVVLRDEDGDLMKLRDLPMVPRNIAGEASNTSITPPPVPEDRLTVRVININPGANLNIRRNPTTDSEVLHGMAVNAIAELLGLDESREWAFVEYGPSQGGSITGWVSVNFVEYQRNSTRITLEELEERGLLETIETERIGRVSSDAPNFAPPTPNPVRDAFLATVQINPGANLNMRRTPDVNAEVIARIPSQAQLIIEGRTANEEWLQTTFEGQTGWIAVNFVSITFNGALANVTDIPVIEVGTGVDTPPTEEAESGE